jgi:hypothetical protein
MGCGVVHLTLKVVAFQGFFIYFFSISTLGMNLLIKANRNVLGHNNAICLP